MPTARRTTRRTPRRATRRSSQRGLLGALLAVAALLVVAVAVPRLLGTTRPSTIPEITAAGEGGQFEAYRYPADFNAIAAEALAASFQADGTVRSDCRQDDTSRDFALCIGHAYGNLTLAAGPEEALRQVTIAMRDTNSGEYAHCHMTVHTIGVAAYQRANKDVGKAFAAGTPVCVNGYYHGVISAYMQTLGLDPKDESEAAVEVVANICGASAISAADPDGTACLHGLGHAMMNHTLYNLPFAIAVCDRVKAEATAAGDDQADHRFYMCSDGSFHENFNAPAAGMPTTWLSAEDPIYPCNAVPDRFQPSCFVNIYLQLQRVTGYDFKKMIPYCPTIDTPVGQLNFDLCTIGWAVGYTSGGGGYAGGQSISEGCALLPVRWFERCTIKVASAITAQFPERVIGLAMCPALTDANLRRECFDGVYAPMQERGSGNVRCGELADLAERRICAVKAAGPGQSTELP